MDRGRGSSGCNIGVSGERRMSNEVECNVGMQKGK